MSEPVKIVVTAETQAAAAALQAFTKDTAKNLKEVASAAGHSESELSKNRMALMELGHVARSTGEALAFGMNPLRVLALEAPRMIQANAMLTDGMKARIAAFLPALGGVGLALGAGVLLWKYYGESLVDPTRRARELATALEKLPEILNKIAIAQRAGTLTPAQAQKYQDMLSGKTPLYNQTTIADAYGGHASSVKNGALGLFGEAFPQLTTDPNLRNSRTGAIIGQRQPANQQDISKYVEQLMRTNKVTDANDQSNVGDEALAKLNDEEVKIRRDAEVGTQKEIDRIKDRYEIERRQIAETREVAVAAHRWTDNDQKKYDDTLASSKIAEANSIAEIQQRVGDEAARKQAEAENKIREQYAKDFREANKQIEDQITNDALVSGHKRDEFYFRENVEKMALATQYLLQGKLSEEEYNDATGSAQKALLAGVEKQNAQYEHQLQLKQELARSDAQMQLKTIQSNPFLTDIQKGQQTIGPIQSLMSQNTDSIAGYRKIAAKSTDESARIEAMNKVNQLMLEQVDLQRQLEAAENADSFTYQLGEVIVKLQNVGTVAQQAAQVFSSVWTTATDSMTKNFAEVIERHKGWGQALRSIYKSVVDDFIQGMVHMVVQWIMQHVIMQAISTGFHAITTALHITAETVKTTATVAGATTRVGANAAEAGSGAAASQAGIPFAGPVLAIAAMVAVFAAVMALSKGFAEGGYTGAGGKYDVRGVVHAGEYVMPASAVDRIGVDTLMALHHGGSAPAAASPAAGGGQGGIHNAVYFDMGKMIDALHRSDAHEKYVVDVMSRNIHKFR